MSLSVPQQQDLREENAFLEYTEQGGAKANLHEYVPAATGNVGRLKSWKSICSTKAAMILFTTAILLCIAAFHQAGSKVHHEAMEHQGAMVVLASASSNKSCNGNMFSDRQPTLFCWSIMLPKSFEEALIKSQLEKRVGIFACNDYVVISRQKRWLGKDDCGHNVYTWVNDVKPADKGNFGSDGQKTNSFLNTEIFMFAWETLISSPKIWANEWIAKVDPDAVFFPDRLRLHVKEHTGETVFYTNCWWDMQIGPKGGLMFGSLEVYSKKAIGAYHASTARCKGLDWHGWGEDMYMQKCMEELGVTRIADFDLVRDDSCGIGNGSPCKAGCGAPCTQGDRAAFHPFKDTTSYWKCWNETAR